MATIKINTTKTVNVELEFEIKDGIYCIGHLSDVKQWGKYYRLDRIVIQNSKVVHKTECLYLDSIRIDGKSLLHGMDRFEFEKIVKAQTGNKNIDIHGSLVIIDQELFFEYYNQTMSNINKKLLQE